MGGISLWIFAACGAQKCFPEALVNLLYAVALAELLSHAGRPTDDIHEDEKVGLAR
jgi:hypothetical protein